MQVEFIAQYFNIQSGEKDRIFSPAGVSKMDYYLSVLKELGNDTCIYSTCATNKNGFQKAKTVLNKFGQKVQYRSSFGSKNSKIKFLDLVWGRILLFIHLIFSSNNRNKIYFIYHERLYSPIIGLVAKLRNLNIIMDVEELYTVAANHSQKNQEKEIRSLDIVNAAYIFPSKRLRDIVLKTRNKNNTHTTLCSGNYSSSNIIQMEGERKSIIYAGTFEAAKGSAIMALNAAKFLPDTFTLYICGFGTEREVEDIKNRITQHNTIGEGCKIKYKGSLVGDEYTSLLSMCEIGLAIQNPYHEFNNTSFPSKILEYLRFGLKVVSSEVSVVREDKCSSIITFFNPFTPESLAEAILTVDNQPKKDSRKLLSSLHDEFKNELSLILETRN